MKVILKDNVYEMDRNQFIGLLGVPKKSVKCGIYAVEKDGIAEMKNETYKDEKSLLKSVCEYKNKGFKVYFNR